MNRLFHVLSLVLACCATSGRAQAQSPAPETDWLSRAGHGVFMHVLPGSAEQFALLQQFDVEALAAQLEQAGAGYLVVTLGQNSGYYNAPNAAYDAVTGSQPGKRCSTRDLPLELHKALEPRGIRLLLYLPCQVPNQDRHAQQAFGLTPGEGDRPIDTAFARRWARVIGEWSDRYGDKVAGWWFDGGYSWIGFNEEIAGIYAAAVRHGNPRALVTFNPGVKLVRWTKAENYTAGELNDPFDVLPNSRGVDGSQWHALTFLGSQWGQRDTRHPDDAWAKWVAAVVAQGGAVTLDVGPNWDSKAGPIGTIAGPQLRQLKTVRVAVDALRQSR